MASEETAGSAPAARVVKGAAALSKGLNLLDLIGRRPRPPRFIELQREAGLPKATLHRMLHTLMEHQLVRFDDTAKTYHLGRKLLELAHRVWDEFDIRGAAAPCLERLAQQYNATASLSEIDGDSIVYVDQRVAPSTLSYRSELGSRVPTHGSASGKAILAFSTPRVQGQFLRNGGLLKLTEHTITDGQRLKAELALTRARGYGISDEELDIGLRSVAAPIMNHQGEAVAAISVSGLKDRMPTDRLHVIGRDVMAAARQVSGTVGAAPSSITPPARPSEQTGVNAACILPWDSYLGEGPLWLADEGCLYWLDILAPAVHRLDLASGENRTTALPKLVAAVVPFADRPGFAALTNDGLETLDFESGLLSPICEPEANLPENRFNDGKCDRQGRLWAGTMRLDGGAPTGSLYSFGAAGRWQRRDSGFLVSNGLDWSPDDRYMYFCDSGAAAIYRYEFDLASGELGERTTWVEIEKGRPDGMTVDAQGHVWCAIWDGWAVHRYDPDGTLVETVGLPVPRPTSCTFGGPDLKTLLITTARIRLSANLLAEAPLSGGIFAHEATVGGRPVATYRFGG